MTALFSNAVSAWPAALLCGVALVCAATDLWKGQIYNAVTYPAILAGFVLQLALHGTPGLGLALGGLAVGFFPAFLLFMLGGLGGGDVKLLGAVGAIGGMVPVTETLLIAFFVGALFALGKLSWHGKLFASLGHVLRVLVGYLVPGLRRVPLETPGEARLTVRFGLAVCVATLATLWDLNSGAIRHLVLG